MTAEDKLDLPRRWETPPEAFDLLVLLEEDSPGFFRPELPDPHSRVLNAAVDAGVQLGILITAMRNAPTGETPEASRQITEILADANPDSLFAVSEFLMRRLRGKGIPGERRFPQPEVPRELPKSEEERQDSLRELALQRGIADMGLVFDLLDSAARQGHAIAAYTLAVYLEEGYPVGSHAVRFKQTSDGGTAVRLNVVDLSRRAGKDIGRSAYYWSLAAHLGHPKAVGQGS